MMLDLGTLTITKIQKIQRKSAQHTSFYICSILYESTSNYLTTFSRFSMMTSRIRITRFTYMTYTIDIQKNLKNLQDLQTRLKLHTVTLTYTNKVKIIQMKELQGNKSLDL